MRLSFLRSFHTIYLDDPVILRDCAKMKPPRKSEMSKKIDTRINRGKVIAFLEKNRGKPQYRPTPSAGMAINRVIRPLSKRFGPGVGLIKDHWPEIVGNKWSKLSRPVTIRGSREGKTLLIEAQGPAATLLQANGDRLLEKINQYLGADAITKLKIQQGSILSFKSDALAKTSDEPEENHVQSVLDKAPDNDLEKALNKLGKKIRARECD